MRSVIKFISYALLIILLPSFVMLFVISLDTSNFMLIFLGQILVFLILLSFYFLIRRNTKKYRKIKKIKKWKNFIQIKSKYNKKNNRHLLYKRRMRKP